MFLLLYTCVINLGGLLVDGGFQGFTSKKGNPSQKKKVCIQKKGSLKNFPYSHSWIIYFVYT
jgi:hypothetical protein